MMNSDSSNLAAPLDEQLVSYLDGELDAEGSRRIEELLATDPEVRRRLQAMEQTWDLLDELDAAPVGGQFTDTTLEMVAVAVREEVEQTLAEAPRRRRRRLWVIGLSLAAAAAAGFLAVALHGYYSNRQLLQDLPVLENLDEYRQVDSFEFLGLLAKKKWFSDEGDDTSHGAPTKADVPMEQRAEFIEKLSASEKERLAQQEERFASLDRNHQQRLRDLHDALQAAPDAEHLRHVMQRYCDWTMALSSFSRAELSELGPPDRIQRIEKELKDEEAREGGRRPSHKDAEAVLQWMNDYATRHEAQVLARLPEPQQKEWNEYPPLRRHRLVFQEIWLPWLAWLTPFGRPGGRLAQVTTPPQMWTDEDWTLLLAALNLDVRKRLEQAKPSEKWQLVAVWCRHALQQARSGAKNARGGPPTVDDEGLADFFEKTLTGNEQDRLLNLPGEEMQRALLQLYRSRTRPSEGPGSRSDGQKGRRLGGPSGVRPAPEKSGKEPPSPDKSERESRPPAAP